MQLIVGCIESTGLCGLSIREEPLTSDGFKTDAVCAKYGEEIRVLFYKQASHVDRI